MPRSIWTGAISFGLVTVPVKMYSAVSRKTVRFHQLNGKTGMRIQQKPGELESLDPKKTKAIEIEDFVALDEIDPIYYDHPYYLVPGPGGAKPYRLLLEAMRETGRVAIATVVIRSKQQLVAVRPMGDDVLGMATMVFPDEVIDPSTIEELSAVAEVEIKAQELKIAEQLINSLAGPFDPDKYRDSYRDDVLALIDRKAQGEQIAVQPAAEEDEAPVPDLMSALKASLDAVKARDAGGGGGGGAAKKSGAKRPAAKKSADKKTPSKQS
jgi:DNA end-binding protein Ku